MERNTFFESANDLIAYLYARFPDSTPLSPIKIQKILYFMFAYYGANIGSITEQDTENTDMDETYPKYLFPEKFEAWRYGPVIRDIYFKNKNNEYDDFDKFDYSNLDSEVLEYLDDLFVQLNDINDFSLVQRSHLDKAWKETYDSNQPYRSDEMNNELIIKEYMVE